MTDFFEALGLWGNIGVFILAAAIILIAGTMLEKWATKIGKRTKYGEVLAGMLLLAIVTSLPDITTSATAALRGHSQLAVNNLLGGVVIQTMVLALADAIGSKKALTGVTPSYTLMIQGVGLIFVLATTAFVAALEEHWQLKGRWTNLGPAGIALVYCVMQYITIRTQGNERWKPSIDSEEKQSSLPQHQGDESASAEGANDTRTSLARLLVLFALGALAVCLGGWTIVVSIEQVAKITGASEGFLGFTVVAFATSLPELSTTITAARRGRNITAASNIFGSNGFNTALLLLIALIAKDSIFIGFILPVVAACSLGIFLTAIYLLGMLERRDRTVVRMGWDSAAVIVVGLLGMWAMFTLTQ